MRPDPIDRYSRATVRPNGRDAITVADAASHAKVAAAMEKLSERLWLSEGFEVAVSSELPQGKGMASSTADLVAAIGAALDWAGAECSVDAIARLLVEIEPSDCTHVPGVAHVGHLCGTVFGSFAPPPALRTLVVDCGGIVDTISFDRARAHHVYDRHEATVRTALSLALRSLASGNVVGLARAATMSARLNQQILPKPQLDDLLALTEEQGGLGVCCAHSGSVLGLLYRPGEGREQRLRRAVTASFGADAPIIGDHCFVSGGIHVRQH